MLYFRSLAKRLWLPFVAAVLLFSSKAGAQGVTDITLEGKIDKYPIVMEISVWGGGGSIIGGSYYYKSKGPKNAITLSEDQNIQQGEGSKPVLEETIDGKNTGAFYARYWDGEVMHGTWIRSKDGKQLPFSLKVTKRNWHYIE